MFMKQYFFKSLFGLWLVLKSLFIGCVTGLMLAVIISFVYYYAYDQLFSHWIAVTCILMASISVFWLYSDFKPTMAQADKVAEMDSDEIIAQIILWVILGVVIAFIALALYGAYHMATV